MHPRKTYGIVREGPPRVEQQFIDDIRIAVDYDGERYPCDHQFVVVVIGGLADVLYNREYIRAEIVLVDQLRPVIDGDTNVIESSGGQFANGHHIEHDPLQSRTHGRPNERCPRHQPDHSPNLSPFYSCTLVYRDSKVKYLIDKTA